jgi:hypothetical protein
LKYIQLGVLGYLNLKVKVGRMNWKLKVIGGGKELQSSLGPGAASNDPAAGEAGGGGTRLQRSPGQAVWCGTKALWVYDDDAV